VTLSKCNAWWQGPAFLLKPEIDWPETKIDTTFNADEEMKRRPIKIKLDQTLHIGTVPPQDADVWRLNSERF